MPVKYHKKSSGDGNKPYTPAAAAALGIRTIGVRQTGPQSAPTRIGETAGGGSKTRNLQNDMAQRDLALGIGQSQQDLALQIRSEFPFDGTETYLEAYQNTVKFVLANIFTNRKIDNYFLLGSAGGAGILGSHLLGSNTASTTRLEELNTIQDFTEEFTSTTYRDGSTTAVWGTSGSLTFGPGSIAVFNSWKSGSFELTYFDRIRIDVDYSVFGSGLNFEASFNGGSNYFTVFQSIESTGSPVGSDFRLKITDPTGSTVINRIDIITKGENFPASQN